MGYRGLTAGLQLCLLFVVNGINMTAQFSGILVTVILAAVSGLISGRIVAVSGHRTEPYTDAEEFEGE